MSSNSVLFVLPNINGTYADAYSFGLASIASVARDKGWDYQYVILKRHEDCESLVRRVEAERPKILAFSTVSSQFSFVKEISTRVRAELGAGVVQICGGVHATISPECILEAPGLDGIFIGEGEGAFRDFLDRVAAGTSFRDVKNFAYADGGQVRKNPLYPQVKDLDSLPYPERERYGYQRFIDQDGYATFFFSRGCPYQCTYCSNHALAAAYGLKINIPRYRSPAKSVEEIKALQRQGYRFGKVFVDDDTFGVDRSWAREFCDRYAREVALPLVCQLRVNLVNDELMKNLKRAGCVHVSCGVESGNEHIHNTVMKRNLTERQIVRPTPVRVRLRLQRHQPHRPPDETQGASGTPSTSTDASIPRAAGSTSSYPYRGRFSAMNASPGADRQGRILRIQQRAARIHPQFPPETQRLIYFTGIGRPGLPASAALARMLLTKRAQQSLPGVWNALKKLKAGLS